MLTRIYIDNYRCFEKFELKLKNLSLIMGANGTGKSTIFEVLHKIHQLVGGYTSAAHLFDQSSCTRWSRTATQTFELTFSRGEESYRYHLEIKFGTRGNAVIATERSFIEGGKYFYQFDGEIALIQEPADSIVIIPAGNNISPLSNLPTKASAPRLRWLVQRIVGMWALRPVPPLIDHVANPKDDYLEPDLRNFASWLYFLASQRPSPLKAIEKTLKETLDGFQRIDFKKEGVRRFLLNLVFKSGRRKPVEFGFNELSEGQRALVVLWTILHYIPDEDTVLCIDEPESYLALREIQPWLNELMLQAEDGVRQVLLISHHPKVVDALASHHGIWLERTPVGPVRALDVGSEKGGFNVSELIARGWLDG